MLHTNILSFIIHLFSKPEKFQKKSRKQQQQDEDEKCINDTLQSLPLIDDDFDDGVTV